jgi:hypothetical protein
MPKASLIEKPKPQSKPHTYEPEPAPPDYTVIKGLSRTKIADISARVAEISSMMKALKEEKDELTSKGAAILIQHHIKTVMVGELRVTAYSGVSRSLSKELLVEHGVGLDVIQQSYKESPYTTLRVTAKGEGE